jgi:MFS family permease
VSRLEKWARLDPRVWQIAFARAVNTMGLSLVMSYLAIYIVEDRGCRAVVYGLICVAANVGQSWANAWAGNLSDRIGRLPLIRNALFARAAIVALLGAQVGLDAPMWSIALNIIVSSSVRGCFEPVAYALVSDVVHENQRISAFGLQRMGTNLGWAIGPALGGMLTLWLPYSAIFYLAGAAILIAGVLTLRIADPVRTRARTAPIELRGAVASALADPLLRLLLPGTFLCALLETQMFSTLSIYMTDGLHLSKAAFGWLYTINGVGVLVLQVPALFLIRRVGISTTLPWASLLDAAGFAMFGLCTGFSGAALAMVTLTAAEVVFDPSHQTAIAEICDPAHRGRTYGVVGLAQTIGLGLAPLIGSLLIDTIGNHHAMMWSLIACFGIGQAICFAVFVRRRKTAWDHVRTPAPRVVSGLDSAT